MGANQTRLFGKSDTRLINRPLLYLLPFFITGLATGPSLLQHHHLLWRLAALIFMLVLVHTLVRKQVYFFPLALLFFLVGAAGTAQTLTPPSADGHVFHFKNRDGLIFGGIIAEMPSVSEGRTRLVVEADEMGENSGESFRWIHGRIHLTVAEAPLRILAGQQVRFQAKLRDIGGFSNPGGFDYERYMKARGLWVSAFLSSGSDLILVARPGDHKPEGRYLARIRLKAAEYIDRHTMQPARGIFKAMLIGIRDEVDTDVAETFRVFGLAHLLSISGLHVGVVAFLSYFLCIRLLLMRPDLALKYNLKHLAALISVIPVLSYAALAGGRPSTIRAAVMVVVFLLSVLIDRRRDGLTALAAAAWFILILQPAAVFLASFQLSFAAAGTILLTYHRFLADPGNAAESRDLYYRRRLRQLVLIPLAAGLGTAPIVAWHFHRLPILSLPVNVLFTPLISLTIIPGGLAALILAPLFPPAAGVLFYLLERGLWCFILPLNSLAGCCHLEWSAPRPGVLFLVCYYLLFLVVVGLPKGPKTVRKWLVAAAVLAVIAAAPMIYRQTAAPSLEMTVLDVGHGNATHLSFPDHRQMIIDGGGFPGSSFDPGEGLIAPYLVSSGVTRLDIIILSHPHADHVMGLPHLAENFHPAELWTNQAPVRHPAYRDLMRIALERDMIRPGLEILHQSRRFGSAEMQVLWPPPDYQTGRSVQDILDSQNDDSLVIKVTFGEIAFLIPGDLEERGVAGLIRKWGDRLRADVLLAPHHGDDESLPSALLEAVRPRYVVFSAGRFNRFQLPSPGAVQRAIAAGCIVLRTDRDGAVSFASDGLSLKMKTNR